MWNSYCGQNIVMAQRINGAINMPGQKHWSLHPRAIFEDHTYLDTKEDVTKIEEHCMAYGCFALINYDEELGCWVFHTLLTEDGLKSVKLELAERFVQKVGASKSEKELEDDIARSLAENGLTVHRQVSCVDGIADIVTNDAIYEIKEPLTRDSFFKAIGQVLIYRNALNPRLRAVIVYQTAIGNIKSIHKEAEQLGIEVLQWKK